MSHYKPIPLPTEKESRLFWKKVNKDAEDGCWEWTASRNKQNTGYGQFGIRGKIMQAHRVSYTWANGPVPDGLELDHLCRNKVCVNPDHLEAVDRRTNQLRTNNPMVAVHRSGLCAKGLHKIEGFNIEYMANGNKRCKACHHKVTNDFKRKRSAELRALGLPAYH